MALFEKEASQYAAEETQANEPLRLSVAKYSIGIERACQVLWQEDPALSLSMARVKAE